MLNPKRIVFTIALALIVSLAGATLAQDDDITLDFWRPNNNTGSDDALYDDDGLLLEWESENPSVQIDAENPPFEQYDTQLITALRAGEAPDLVLINHVTVGTAIATDGLAPLDECVGSQDSIVLDEFIRGLDLGIREGTRYTIPWNTDARVMYYNMNILEKAGIEDVPQTWDELREAFDAVSELDGVDPIAYAGGGKWAILYMWLGNWMVQQDTSVITSEGDASAAMTDATREAFDYAVSMAQYSPEASVSYLPPDVHSLFAQGEIAFLIQGPWANGFIQSSSDMELGVDYDVAPIPGANEDVLGAGALGGWHLAISENSDHYDEACAFIAWAVQPEIMAQANIFNIPARTTSINSETFQSHLSDNPVAALAAQQASVGAIPVSPVPELPEITTIISEAFNRAVVGQYTVDEALEEIDFRLNELLERR